MKLWFNNKNTQKDKNVQQKQVGQELSDELLAQISGGAKADMSGCHTANA